MLRPASLVILLGLTAAPPSYAGADDAFAGVIVPFLRQHCYDCHGPAKQNNRIRYDQLAGFRPADRHLWTLVHEQLATGQMPPDDRPRPAEGDRQRVLAWIAEQQRLTRATGTRRLNRRELAAALRDVTGLDVDYAAALPDDGRVDGFDTGADGLQDAADSVAQVMTVTRRAVDAIRFLDPAPAPADLIAANFQTAPGKEPRRALEPFKKAGLIRDYGGDSWEKIGLGVLIRPKWVGDRGGFDVRVLPPPNGKLGVIRVKAVVSVVKPVAGIPNPRLWIEVGGKEIDFPEIANPPERPRTLEYEVQLSDVVVDAKGLGVTLASRVEVPYALDGFPNDERAKPEENVPGGTGLFRPLFDTKKIPNDQQPVPFVVLHSLEIDRDYRPAWPPAAWKADVGTIADDTASARRLIALWIDRAWRRPVPEAEQQRFVALYEKLRGQKMSFDDALRATFQSILMAGSFRYLPSPADLDTPTAQHATASRLSLMLWGRPPDDALRKLAAAGKLRDPATLDRQVDRLLNDPRSDAFVRPFVTQWPEMGQPITVAMDHIQKQDFRFGRHLKASMREETIQYVAALIRENRPAGELFSSDWTMMNDVLARHYGYDGVVGGDLRKITLRKDDPRGGGLLAHAGLQSMLCWMGENWVIYRGAWALRHLLDSPPPPPPLEVPELTPSDGKNAGKTFKQLLVQHQADPKCSVCHKDMDPLGFAFQNFDLAGRWRDVEYEKYSTKDLDGKIEWRGVGKTRPVDAEGRLPRGEAFKTFGECKALLAKNYTNDLARGLLKNLVLYGTGAKADVDAMREIRQILADQGPKGLPMRDLVKAVVRTRAFAQN